MNSFNVYKQTEKKIGGNTPVWLGTVKPVPVGYILDVEEALTEFPDGLVPAGTAVQPIINEDDKIISVSPISSAVNAASGAIGYIYNDVYVGKDADENTQATCAVVQYHAEGLMIERVYPTITEEQIRNLQKNIPGVLLVRG